MFDGKGNGNGAIFMDKDDSAPGVVDQQTTIYGHHMYDGSMFNIIDKTRDQATFDSIKSVYYITRDATYRFEPLCTTQVQDDYGNARVPNFTDDTTFVDYLSNMVSRAKAKASDADERVSSSDKVLTLVTCAGEIIPRTTRAAMVCTLVDAVSR